MMMIVMIKPVYEYDHREKNMSTTTIVMMMVAIKYANTTMLVMMRNTYEYNNDCDEEDVYRYDDDYILNMIRR